jgi:hypothetical protein
MNEDIEFRVGDVVAINGQGWQAMTVSARPGDQREDGATIPDGYIGVIWIRPNGELAGLAAPAAIFCYYRERAEYSDD